MIRTRMGAKDSLRRRPRCAIGFAAAVFITVLSGRAAQVSSDRPQWTDIPRPEAIEEQLFAKLNEERSARNLPRLRLSPDLVRLARAQSREMAESGVLTHASAAGKSLKERLDEAGFLYTTSGENVARSDSFLSGFIHESFMKSSAHRDNILDPGFDEAGVGVVSSKDATFFVTVDFLKSLTPKSDEYVRFLLLSRLNDARKGASAPDLVLIPEASEIAASYAKARGGGREVKANPDVLGMARVHFLMGPDLEEIATKLAGRASTSAPAGGLGSWFGRSDEYPGGAYCICAILLQENPSLELRGAQMAEAVLESANGARRALGLAPLATDEAMSRLAEGFLKKAKPRVAPTGTWIAVYETGALSVFPIGVRAKFEDKTYNRIGLAVLRSLEKTLAAAYTVALVLAE